MNFIFLVKLYIITKMILDRKGKKGRRREGEGRERGGRKRGGREERYRGEGEK